MNEAVEIVENDEFGIDDLIEAEETEKAQAQAEAARPDDAELQKARLLAEKMNAGFLFGVNKLVCPSVDDLEQLIDREAGNDALLPLAMELGGEVPPWLVALQEKYGPWIGAGMYMGTTIYTLKKAEKQLQADDAQNGGEHGEE